MTIYGVSELAREVGAGTSNLKRILTNRHLGHPGNRPTDGKLCIVFSDEEVEAIKKLWAEAPKRAVKALV